MDYRSFQSYPIQIVGISSDYNAKITSVENFVKSDMAYSGDEAGLESILPFFVFWFFCNDLQTTVMVEAGEAGQVKEFSFPDTVKQDRAWNIGVDKLIELVATTGASVNSKYLSKRSLL